MTQPATPVFEFVESLVGIELTRLDVASPAFLAFRRCVRRLIDMLREDPEATAVADRLQYSLLQWLSVPMPFEDYDVSPMVDLGSPGTIRAKWGSEARDLFVGASGAFTELRAGPSPLRLAVESELLDAAAHCGSIRVYCHRTARAHFESLPGWSDACELAEVGFLGSPRDYRVSAPFDALLKVGPLRSKGFSSAPGALLNAPRFRKLIQIVWHGTPDEPGFGEDPVLRAWGSREDANGQRTPGVSAGSGGITVHRRSALVGDPTPRDVADLVEVDDFAPERRGAPSGEGRRGILFHLSNDLGCLHAPHADIICVGRDGEAALVSRLEPRDVDARYSHLVDPNLDDVDFGSVSVSREQYAPQWKSRLAEEYRRSPTELTRTLRVRGIDLDTLDSRIELWIHPSTSVVHSPQQWRHFQILIGVLGMDGAGSGARHDQASGWARSAWSEISRSRSVAIQHGTERHEIIAEELVTLITNDWSSLNAQLTPGRPFTWEIPAERALAGRVKLHAILEIEDGYRCPDLVLRQIGPLERLLKWRG